MLISKMSKKCFILESAGKVDWRETHLDSSFDAKPAAHCEKTKKKLFSRKKKITWKKKYVVSAI